MAQKKKTAPKPEPTATDEPKQVVCHLRPSELEVMKNDTGAEKDGSAVAAYVRKRMKREQTDK